MVPADRILDTAAEQGAAIVGLSGLITPSLDEMVNVAREMERRGLELPLLIGGATTSRQHTAVRIAPEYGARRSTCSTPPAWSASSPTSSTRCAAASWMRGTARTRSACASSSPSGAQAAARARGRAREPASGSLRRPAGARRTGAQVVEPELATLREYIDWQFFFHAWELKGRFPAILERPEARELYDDAQDLLDEIVRDESLAARGVYGFWPAHADGDDVVVDEGTRFSFLRQQSAYGDSRPNRSLADYVAPERRPPRRLRGRDPRRRRSRRPLRGRA